MDLGSWKRRKFTPEWGGNKEQSEPCSILFTPPTVEWMSRWKGLALQAPAVVARAESEPKELAAWEAEVREFRAEMLGALVVGFVDLTTDGIPVTRDEGLAFVLENSGLLEELFSAMIRAGGLGASGGKG